ncbi:hypothetical protein BKP35_16465 [Anaerobacillus arseniciselenatis]|uniref:Uncharacterized protein n=1 Tax=Anaerobacillus arseniciselenatis TaxID=85682 RepID=A0A1S2LCJ6_9BACI|nr:hypothetical protein [Anaerobacillus arseniciselenatis]OIJ09447.1 hypothetical protein BKP35_16465 [Anaerobacillus arseniciselenatis]
MEGNKIKPKLPLWLNQEEVQHSYEFIETNKVKVIVCCDDESVVVDILGNTMQVEGDVDGLKGINKDKKTYLELIKQEAKDALEEKERLLKLLEPIKKMRKSLF